VCTRYRIVVFDIRTLSGIRIRTSDCKGGPLWPPHAEEAL